MLKLFYDKNEEIPKNASINCYSNFYYKYNQNFPSLEDALKQMIFSTGIKYDKANELVDEILSKTEKIVKFNYDMIKEKYPILNREEAKIISSYSCETTDSNYNPCIILNRNLNDENREKGLKNISKYLFIFLKTLRKLDRYYPKPPKKYLYRCISYKVSLDKDPTNNNLIPYIIGNKKIFWGFTSTSPNPKTTIIFLGKNEQIKTGTIFTLTGDV